MIIIHCYSCNKKYHLDDQGLSVDDRLQIIQFAKCTACGVPRDPIQFNQYKPGEIEPLLEHVEGKCDVCGENIDNKKWNLCHKHYIASWKRATHYNTRYMREWRKRKSLHNDNI